jgi:hypothetical protein
MFTMMLNIIEEIYIFTSNFMQFLRHMALKIILYIFCCLLHFDLYYVKIKKKS